LFDAATLGGAKALGRDDIGSLAPGARADIAVFGLDDMMMAPSIDPITTLVTGGSGKVTQAVFVDGRLSMRFGDVAGIDMKAARQRAQQQYDGLVAKYPERAGIIRRYRDLSAKLSDRGQRRWLKPTKPYLRSVASS
jgi:hypothetical protein